MSTFDKSPLLGSWTFPALMNELIIFASFDFLCRASSHFLSPLDIPLKIRIEYPRLLSPPPPPLSLSLSLSPPESGVSFVKLAWAGVANSMTALIKTRYNCSPSIRIFDVCHSWTEGTLLTLIVNPVPVLPGDISHKPQVDGALAWASFNVDFIIDSIHSIPPIMNGQSSRWIPYVNDRSLVQVRFNVNRWRWFDQANWRSDGGRDGSDTGISDSGSRSGDVRRPENRRRRWGIIITPAGIF